MFDFDSYIRMLELVLCSGRDGAQDPGFCLLGSRLRFCGLLSLLYDSFTGWLRPCLSLFINPHWMAASIPWIVDLQVIPFIWMVVPMPWISSHSPCYPDGCVHTVDSCFDMRYVYVYASLICRSPDSVCPPPCQKLVKHPNHHSLFCLHALGGICYTIFCHASCTFL